MSQGMWAAVIAVVIVAVLGLLMRRSSVSSVMRSAAPAAPGDVAEEQEASEEPGTAEAVEEYISDQVVALSSDGIAFVPDGETVRLSQARGPDLDVLRPGDLLHARLVRGAPDHDPWRLEALGRDRELRAWRFEAEDAADAALALVSRSIVVAPRDEDGAEVVFGDADFVEARRREEEIERELASMPDVEERPEEPTRRPYE